MDRQMLLKTLPSILVGNNRLRTHLIIATMIVQTLIMSLSVNCTHVHRTLITKEVIALSTASKGGDTK